MHQFLRTASSRLEFALSCAAVLVAVSHAVVSSSTSDRFDSGPAAASCSTVGHPSLLQVSHSSSVKAVSDALMIHSDTDADASQETESTPQSEGFDVDVKSGDAALEEALTAVEVDGVKVASKPGDRLTATDFFASDASQKLSDAHGVKNNASRQEPSGGLKKEANVSCTPACTWSCSSPVCEEECEPLCKDPRCETRCATVELAGCQLECEQPECCTVCPKRHCVQQGCPQCTTKCSEPLCKLRCPQKQNCTSVCESPICKWHCKKPEKCPEPECKLECDMPSKQCKNSVHTKIPALKKGEIKVASFVPPTSLLQLSAGVPLERGGRRLPAWVETAGGEGAQPSGELFEFPVA